MRGRDVHRLCLFVVHDSKHYKRRMGLSMCKSRFSGRIGGTCRADGRTCVASPGHGHYFPAAHGTNTNPRRWIQVLACATLRHDSDRRLFLRPLERVTRR
ncbi:unnamed protein product [Mycena citricolor]|uniref:Uncharacterized protein n=1 Tax=Mycena citricolor TaxID=2018698 RepID=A0AAD2I030_9AGAR|nr:unnamed protein product [Mycena citricolor]CAK5283869.1 unnamed protein product [Mycena citricolor]